MKLEAINDWVIVKRDLGETVTASGIILKPQDEVQTLELEVAATNETTKQLQGRMVFVQRHKVYQLNPDTDVKYGAVKLEDILAVRA